MDKATGRKSHQNICISHHHSCTFRVWIKLIFELPITQCIFLIIIQCSSFDIEFAFKHYEVIFNRIWGFCLVSRNSIYFINTLKPSIKILNLLASAHGNIVLRLKIPLFVKNKVFKITTWIYLKILYWKKNSEDSWQIKQNHIHPYESMRNAGYQSHTLHVAALFFPVFVSNFYFKMCQLSLHV